MGKLVKKKKIGRPSVYDTRIKPNLKLIHTLRANGYTHMQIIKLLDISETSYYKHKAEIDEFTESFKKADATLINQLENSLYDLALGRAQKVVEVNKETIDMNGNIRDIKEKRVETLAPHATSIFFALNNLDGSNWKHRNEHTHNFDEENMKEVKSFTDIFTDMMKDIDEKE